MPVGFLKNIRLRDIDRNLLNKRQLSEINRIEKGIVKSYGFDDVREIGSNERIKIANAIIRGHRYVVDWFASRNRPERI